MSFASLVPQRRADGRLGKSDLNFVCRDAKAAVALRRDSVQAKLTVLHLLLQNFHKLFRILFPPLVFPCFLCNDFTRLSRQEAPPFIKRDNISDFHLLCQHAHPLHCQSHPLGVLCVNADHSFNLVICPRSRRQGRSVEQRIQLRNGQGTDDPLFTKERNPLKWQAGGGNVSGDPVDERRGGRYQEGQFGSGEECEKIESKLVCRMDSRYAG